MRFQNYEEAERWVLGRKSILVYYEPFAAALHEAGDPQNGLLCFHVAGTNGKGSTCRILYQILKTKYSRVGLYTSPQLESIRDRIRINDAWIPESVFLDYANRYADIIEKYQLGMVGISTLFCFLWFKEQGTDAAVIEVCMGGRYDTTNVIPSPACSIITSIGYDHMEFLGDTLAEIAAEKSGIIKPGCPVVMGALPPEAETVVRETARAQNAPVHEILPYEAGDGNTFTVRGETYEVSISAPYFKYNAVLALTAAETAGFDIAEEAVKNAVRTGVWPGRFETVAEHPRVILDGAHNPDGMEALRQAAAGCARPLIGVFTALKDKQGPAMREMMESFCDKVITTSFANHRADSTAHLGGTVIEDWHEAVERAQEEAGPEGTVLITGSLYFISEVRRVFAGNAQDNGYNAHA